MLFRSGGLWTVSYSRPLHSSCRVTLHASRTDRPQPRDSPVVWYADAVVGCALAPQDIRAIAEEERFTSTFWTNLLGRVSGHCCWRRTPCGMHLGSMLRSVSESDLHKVLAAKAGVTFDHNDVDVEGWAGSAVPIAPEYVPCTPRSAGRQAFT